MRSCYVMSVKPAFLRRILDGGKQYELRRTSVRIVPGDLIVLYGSGPLKAVVGGFTVACVHRGTPEQLWNRYAGEFGVTRAEYNDYFRGAASGCAIGVRRCVEVTPLTLAALRDCYPGFRPPQSYARWKYPPDEVLGHAALDNLEWSASS